jgi:hypothetical protein
MADAAELQQQYPWLVPLVALVIALLVAWVRQTTLSFTFLFFSVSTVLANIRSMQPLRPYLNHARTLVMMYRLVF